jgi:hypothetical protein
MAAAADVPIAVDGMTRRAHDQTGPSPESANCNHMTGKYSEDGNAYFAA